MGRVSRSSSSAPGRAGTLKRDGNLCDRCILANARCSESGGALPGGGAWLACPRRCHLLSRLLMNHPEPLTHDLPGGADSLISSCRGSRRKVIFSESVDGRRLHGPDPSGARRSAPAESLFFIAFSSGRRSPEARLRCRCFPQGDKVRSIRGPARRSQAGAAVSPS